MRKKKDYMVSFNSNERIVSNLTEARKLAKKKSKEFGESYIEKWIYDKYINDMVIDENFQIRYEDGKEVK